MNDLWILVDRNRCSGCGECVSACSEEILALKDGKAVLTDSELCDGSGACRAACPADALILMPRGHRCPPN